MDIILLIIAGFYISKRVKAKGYDHRPFVWRLVGLCLLFDFAGGLFSLVIIKESLFVAAMFGLFCAFGGFLVIKYKVDKLPDQRAGEGNNELPPQ